jgi:hypothetical protein
MPTKKERSIYTITTINLKDGNWDTRCIGYHFSEKLAIKEVEHNGGDMHEDSYEYAVVEEVKDGLYDINRKETWFKWNEAREKYEILDEKPEMFRRTCCYGIG